MRAADLLGPRRRRAAFGTLMRTGKFLRLETSFSSLDARYYGRLLAGLIIRF
jgi:hypothetical protein